MVRDRNVQATWLYEARVKQGGGEKVSRTTGRSRPIWTQAEMSAWLRTEDVPVDDATYRQWETGYKPVTAEYQRLLERAIGAMPEEPEPKPAASDSDGSLAAALADAIKPLVEATNRQAQAIEDLAKVLQPQPAAPGQRMQLGLVAGDRASVIAAESALTVLRALGLIPAENQPPTPPEQ